MLTETYSKGTDIHQFLNPTSCHPGHIFKAIPTALGIRLRRNCSDNYENDSKFAENLREYKGYMITSGYEEKVIDKEFRKLAHVSRKDVLYKKRRKSRKNEARKYRFVTAYEPAFVNIKIVLMKYQHILKDDEELSNVFPNGAKDFQVSERREAKNIKEILVKSKVRMLTNDEDDPGSRPCDKDCSYCHLLREGKDFKSVATDCKYKVKITCEAKDVIYLVTYKRHNIQGVGCTTELKSRTSKYRSHHNRKSKSCGITEHF